MPALALVPAVVMLEPARQPNRSMYRSWMIPSLQVCICSLKYDELPEILEDLGLKRNAACIAVRMLSQTTPPFPLPLHLFGSLRSAVGKVSAESPSSTGHVFSVRAWAYCRVSVWFTYVPLVAASCQLHTAPCFTSCNRSLAGRGILCTGWMWV